MATGAAMYRLQAGPDGPPEIVWRTAYDAGTRQKPGQTSRATGTTPTLFGDAVAITDNADPQMHVVVFDRADGRERCRAPVFSPTASATENSLIAIDGMLVVENNYGYKPAVTVDDRRWHHRAGTGRGRRCGLLAALVERHDPHPVAGLQGH